jgi:two-component system CheB/CheR fusion protein
MATRNKNRQASNKDQAVEVQAGRAPDGAGVASPAEPENAPPAVLAPSAVDTPSASFPIVGIGASAGGLAAFEAFFSGLPAAPAGSPEPPLYLVILEEAPLRDHAPAPPAALPEAQGTDGDDRVAALQQELRAKDDYLQTSNEELETSNEELKSANEEMQSVNEEMQSVNEELQSTNEELETSKEELQSVNEELATVNAELQTKVADLSRANNDMNNLLAGTGIATVFVDHALRILRFTPAATKIINLIPSDLGRPVGHLVSNLKNYDTLVADAQTVLDTLVHKEVEVQTAAGAWYAMRIQPYRTIDNVIEGAVITFVDITKAKQAAAALAGNEARLKLAMEVTKIGVWEWNLETGENTWSDQIWGLYGLTASACKASYDGWLQSVVPADRETVAAAVQAAADDGTEINIEWRVNTADGSLRWLMSRGQPLRDPNGSYRKLSRRGHRHHRPEDRGSTGGAK